MLKTLLISIACAQPIGPVGQHCEALVREQIADECPAEAVKAEEALNWFADFAGENEPPVLCVQVEIEETP